MKTFSILCALCLVILGSSWAAGQTHRGNPRDGQAIYEKTCLRCHGEKLDGNGPEGQYLIVGRQIFSRSTRGPRPIGSC